MLNNLKKKKLLEQLGSNKDVVKESTDTIKSLSVDSSNPGKFHNKSMQKNPMKPDLENKEEDLEKTIGYAKTHQTLGVKDDESAELKKKKMLESLFKVGKK